MAATLANKGINPLTGKQIVSARVVRQVLSVMTTCGMYNSAGDWVTQVGIPAKSGVAGGLLGALPGQIGLATFSPKLDNHGNSVRGVQIYERISRDMGLNLMEIPPTVQSVIRNITVINEGVDGEQVGVYALQGSLRFAGAEKIVREFSNQDIHLPAVALDLTDVHALDRVARRMILEVARRLIHEGKKVYLIDPDDVIPAPNADHHADPEQRLHNPIEVIRNRGELRKDIHSPSGE